MEGEKGLKTEGGNGMGVEEKCQDAIPTAPSLLLSLCKGVRPGSPASFTL